MMPEPKTVERILGEKIYNKGVWQDLVNLQRKGIGKIQVGCVVEAMSYDDDCLYEFHGCNIHVSDSFGDTHAERMAIDLALKARCYPITVYVTSTSMEEDVLLCGSCRHYISEINENCTIVIFNPDGSIKRVSNVKESYPAHKDVADKNKRFFQLCGGLPAILKQESVKEPKE